MSGMASIIWISCVWFLATTTKTTSAFSSPASNKPFSLDVSQAFQNVLDIFSPTTALDTNKAKREQLKNDLLTKCRESESSIEETQAVIESLISELATLTPNPAAAESTLLQNVWRMEWTTEKEINVFQDWGISGDITQTIDGTNLQNLIPFKKGGSFGVTGSLSVPNEGGMRTNFQFTEACLDLGKWGTYKIPPVGAGWFDTIYLDEDLRVDTNSRNDILICTPFSE